MDSIDGDGVCACDWPYAAKSKYGCRIRGIITKMRSKHQGHLLKMEYI